MSAGGGATHDVAFTAMGSRLRLLIGEPGPGMEPAALAAARERRFVAEFEAALSRFLPGSELCRLNDDPRLRVPASPLLRAAVRAGLEAAELSDGLVDPTLADEIEAIGYADSRVGVEGAPLAAALAAAPARHPARPRLRPHWRRIEVDDEAGTISRAPGLRFDSGGTGKGLAADTVAAHLRGHRRFLVDCGGDIRIGGEGALLDPFEVFVAHPLSGELTHALRLGSGGVATSALNARIWRHPEGHYAHHLLDPSTGASAWTGVIAATALGETALEAETLAKMALLAGPEAGRRILAERGGLLVEDSGEVAVLGPISARPVPAPRRGPRRAAAMPRGD